MDAAQPIGEQTASERALQPTEGLDDLSSADDSRRRLITGQRPPLALRPGQLDGGWQVMVAATWTMVFFAFAATWKTSVEIGIGTWWLGPRAQPQPTPIRILPFALAVVVGLCAIYNIRRVAIVSLIGSIGVAVIGAFDISRSGGLAAIELAIAAGAFAVSIGAATGTYRRPTAAA